MNRRVIECNKCQECLNQKILLDFQNNADIMIIGLSARIKKYEDEIPLDSRTRSGKIIDAFENIAQKHCMSVYRTNLVKCAPIDSEKKLRYPNDKEINACFEKLTDEINNIAPKLIILLGNIVRESFQTNFNINICKPKENSLQVVKWNNINIISIYHPSYIKRSKNRELRYYRLFDELYVVDISDYDHPSIHGYKGSLRERYEDILGAVSCAYKRFRRSNSKELIEIGYTVKDFLYDNPMLYTELNAHLDLKL